MSATRPAPESVRFQPPWDAALVLADGAVFRGTGFGANVDALGEAVFTTTMTGYQEVATDPSFRGQIVCMTYPLIGNYGVNPTDDESRRPWIAGMIVREACGHPSNWRSEGSFHSYLEDAGIPAISGIDTRAVTRHIREAGDIRAALVRHAAGLSDADLVVMAQSAPLPGEGDVVGEVIADEVARFGDGNGPHIVVIDCGVKRNIVESFVARGARVTVVPYGTPFADISVLGPDGVVVSPGPGDPANLDDGLDAVNATLESGLPYFGICLGHQLLARSIGAQTGKLKFGHRGGNHPVYDLDNGMVSITAQNHGYYVERDSFPADSPWKVAMVNLNDGTVEGLRNSERAVISVQFHPEASPGPWDSGILFDEFLSMIEKRSQRV
ncbi:MAG: glutamine-hydrolyzing carbamoyl-phosphate synthase small subunit [Thermomicrobiales bacterium]|nr:glutamine-hydrolyzing carbamoyl-phosphate synthase small subunit [Thermomicrobiales bacterium]